MDGQERVTSDCRFGHQLRAVPIGEPVLESTNERSYLETTKADKSPLASIEHQRQSYRGLRIRAGTYPVSKGSANREFANTPSAIRRFEPSHPASPCLGARVERRAGRFVGGILRLSSWATRRPGGA